MARVITICGLQWGDEGKGRVSFELARDVDVVVRAQGGANAGHTVHLGERSFVFHLLPSGSIQPEHKIVLGPAVFIDPQVLAEEIEAITSFRKLRTSDLVVDFRAPVVLSSHKEEDRKGGTRIGTTGRGIGPAAAQFWARRIVTLGEYCERESDPACRVIRPFIGDAVEALWDAALQEKSILIEGAQGVLLDLVFGTYPYVTSSLTGCGALPYLSGLGDIETISIGVTKCYSTRVGNGPFPTEIHGREGEVLREAGGEYGATTGRPRRCGWLDLPALAYAVRVSGVKGIVLTKIDVLSKLGRFKVAVGYFRKGKTIQVARRSDFFDPQISPIYKEFDAGPPDPDAPWVRELITMIEGFAGIPVMGVTFGPSQSNAYYAVTLG